MKQQIYVQNYIHRKIASSTVDLVTVFDAILKSRQTCEKLQHLYENLTTNNFRKTALVYNIIFVN